MSATYRVTTNGTMRMYRANLNGSRQRLNHAMNQVQTGRVFNEYAEDPALASRCFQMRRNYWRAQDQITNNNYVTSKFSTGFSVFDDIVDGTVENGGGLSAMEEALRGLNDPTATGRRPLAQTTLAKAESIVKTMNSQYAGTFIFAGADGLNVPFTWEEHGDGTKSLLFRGVPVDTEDPGELLSEVDFETAYGFPDPLTGKAYVTEEQLSEYEDKKEALAELQDTITKGTFTKEETVEVEYLVRKKNADGTPAVDINGNPEYETTPAKREVTKLVGNYESYQNLHDAQAADLKKLEEMSKEATYVDLGLGMKEEVRDGKLQTISSSAYNSALSGLTFLGYGVDEDGDPKNVISITLEMSRILERCGADVEDAEGNVKPGKFASDEDAEDFQRLTNKLHDAVGRASEQHVKLSADVKYLNQNNTELKDTAYTLNVQIEEMEQVDPALAITSMAWANYSYNAGLKIGNSILSQSLLDFLS